MAHDNLTRNAIRVCLAGALLATIAVFGTSCEEAFGGPKIKKLTIQPDTVPKNDTGMTDEFFDVTIEVAGFEEEIEEVELFIAELDRPAPNNPEKEMTVQGNIIEVNNITKTWFQGQEVEPGTYNIGATVTDAVGTSDTQRNLAQVEVTP